MLEWLRAFRIWKFWWIKSDRDRIKRQKFFELSVWNISSLYEMFIHSISNQTIRLKICSIDSEDDQNQNWASYWWDEDQSRSHTKKRRKCDELMRSSNWVRTLFFNLTRFDEQSSKLSSRIRTLKLVQCSGSNKTW
jgi:hypothetical protein